MEFKEVVKNRYSCKKYSDRQVEKPALEAILEAGRLAPTAKNLQEQQVYVLQSPEALAKVDQITPCRYGAPTVLLVAFDKDNVFTYPGGKRDSGVEWSYVKSKTYHVYWDYRSMVRFFFARKSGFKI